MEMKKSMDSVESTIRIEEPSDTPCGSLCCPQVDYKISFWKRASWKLYTAHKPKHYSIFAPNIYVSSRQFPLPTRIASVYRRKKVNSQDVSVRMCYDGIRKAI